jgi:hypothetical protein
MAQWIKVKAEAGSRWRGPWPGAIEAAEGPWRSGTRRHGRTLDGHGARGGPAAQRAKRGRAEPMGQGR